MCRGTRQLITTGHSGRRLTSELRPTEAHLCRDVFTGVAEELIPLLLAQTGRFPIVLPNVNVNLLLPKHLRIHFSPHVSLHLPQLWWEPTVLDHHFLINEWNWLDSPAEDAVLVAHPNVQMFVLLFDCSTVSQKWDRQEIASAHTSDSLDGQTRALARCRTFSSISRDNISGGIDQL